ncbi:hypothetical protein [Streptomyces sp. NPDC017086]|uniref:hypothetical protein n=1 Tax=Streptomyces sp. NPDC017086 TaxID=3364976 RepID=UPI00378F18E0
MRLRVAVFALLDAIGARPGSGPSRGPAVAPYDGPVAAPVRPVAVAVGEAGVGGRALAAGSPEAGVVLRRSAGSPADERRLWHQVYPPAGWKALVPVAFMFAGIAECRSPA